MVTGVRFLEPSPVTMLSPFIADERFTKMYYMSSDTTSRSNSYLHRAMKNFTLFVIHSYGLKYNYMHFPVATSFELAHYGSQPFILSMHRGKGLSHARQTWRVANVPIIRCFATFELLMEERERARF